MRGAAFAEPMFFPRLAWRKHERLSIQESHGFFWSDAKLLIFSEISRLGLSHEKHPRSLQRAFVDLGDALGGQGEAHATPTTTTHHRGEEGSLQQGQQREFLDLFVFPSGQGLFFLLLLLI